VKNFSNFDQFFLNLKASDDILQTSASSVRNFVPLEIRDSLFILFIIYGCLYNILALLDMMTYVKNFRNVIANIMKNMLVLMTVIKISMLRIKCPVVPNILRVMINSTSKYKLPYKIKPLVKPYNVKNYVFGCIHEFLRIIIIISGYLGTDSFFASIGFHFTSRFAILKCKVENVFNNTDDPRQGIQKIILGHHRLIRDASTITERFGAIKATLLSGRSTILDSQFFYFSVMANFSIEYKLPYKIKPLLKPYDAKSYASGCIYQFFGKTVVLSGYVGTDRLLACTGFHLTGQLAILKCRVKEFLKNNHDTHGRIRRMILRHYRLISLTELERVYRFTFLIYVCLLSCTLYGHCYIGECLIEELINRILIYLQFDSKNVCDVIHHCDWYELSTINLKFLCICMVRARKPLRLTCAKFRVVSLCTFTDVTHSEDIDGVLISTQNIYANKRVKQLDLNIYYTGILLLT
ncbi:odorant receptor 13a-like, partial [Vespula squamosa]